MAEYTPNLNLYKWQVTDEKLTTFQQYSANTDKLDTEIHNLKNITQDTLWSGFMFLQDGQNITPLKNMSACRYGWILVWSDFDPSPDNKVNNWDFVFTYIPKRFPILHNGASMLCSIPITQSNTTTLSTVKQFQVSNSQLIGNANNASSTIGANDVVLRYVLEW